MESLQGNAAFANAGGLAKFLSTLKNLKLVFLNGCSTQGQVDEFHKAGIPAVMATSTLIPDAGAITFAEWFYKALAAGKNLNDALLQAQGSVLTQGDVERHLGIVAQKAQENPDEFWKLYGDDEAIVWTLGDALHDPLFGLPEPQKYDLPAKPFRHLNWFTEKDWEIFFGRRKWIRKLYDVAINLETDPVFLFYGQTGVGKSSVLSAGLMAWIKAKGYEVCYARRDQTLGLVGTLKGALGASDDMLLNESWRKLETPEKPLIIILDQLEEAFTKNTSPKASREEIEAFAAVLEQLYTDLENRPKGKLILSFARSGWLILKVF